MLIGNLSVFHTFSVCVYMCAHVGVHLLYGHAVETGGELLGVRVLSSYHRFWVSDAGLQACLARACGAPCWSFSAFHSEHRMLYGEDSSLSLLPWEWNGDCCHGTAGPVSTFGCLRASVCVFS